MKNKGRFLVDKGMLDPGVYDRRKVVGGKGK